MSLLSGFNVSLPEVNLLGQAATAAFEGGALPAGWTLVSPQQLGIAHQYWDGIYFSNGAASAVVIQQGSSWIISFRGTDDSSDPYYFPQLVTGSYINNFEPLLSAVATVAADGTDFSFTGASLGGGAANQLASIAASAYGEEFAAATFVAFASPNISNASGILNFGFENDPIYRSISGFGDNPSSLDNLVLATDEYMAGNYDGRHPYDEYAHSESELAFDALGRLAASSFQGMMTPDSPVIFDAHSGQVQDVTPGREGIGVFYLGEAQGDWITGRAGNDIIEGFGGDDLLAGGEGNDALLGGAGNDVANGNRGDDIVQGGDGSDFTFGGQGDDQVYGGSGDDQGFGDLGADLVQGNSGSDLLNGGQGNDFVFGGQGDDFLFGGQGDDQIFGNLRNDLLSGDFGNDTMTGGDGADRFLFRAGQGNDTVTDFEFDAGDRLNLEGQTFTVVEAGGTSTLALSGGGTITLNGVTAAEIDSSYFV